MSYYITVIDNTFKKINPKSIVAKLRLCFLLRKVKDAAFER